MTLQVDRAGVTVHEQGEFCVRASHWLQLRIIGTQKYYAGLITDVNF